MSAISQYRREYDAWVTLLRDVLNAGVDITPAAPLQVSVAAILAALDVSDRPGRLLGIIYGDQGQLAQRPVTLDVYAQLRSAGVEVDPRARTWALGAGDVPDLSDRWARQLGLIDVSRVLGAPLTVANPLITGVYDALGNRMPAMDAAARPGFVDVIDRAARLLGIVYGNLGAVIQLAPADAVNPGNVIMVGGLTFVYNGATWDMVREGNVAGSVLADVTDRAARLLGVIYGDQGQLAQDAVTGEAQVISNPITLVDQFNVAELADTDILAAAITPTHDPANWKIYVWADTAGVFRVRRNRAAAWTSENMNSGAPLVANAAYVFNITVTGNDTGINFWYSVAASITLIVTEELI